MSILGYAPIHSLHPRTYIDCQQDQPRDRPPSIRLAISAVYPFIIHHPTMQRIANLDHLRTLYDSARDFLVAYTPLSSPITISRTTSQQPDLPKPSRQPQRLHAACLSPTSSIASFPPDTMRRELDTAKHQLARSNAELAKLEERCRMLEKTLKDTRDILRAREAEIDKMRKEREREGLAKERRRSDVGPNPFTTLLPDIRTSASSPVPARPATAPPPPSSNSTTEEDLARTRASETYLTRTDPDKKHPAMHDTSSRIGQAFTRILANRDHTHDPILVQLALQGCSDSVLGAIYGHMQIAEPQPTSSKWRSLTTLHTHALSDTILRWSADIFLVAGCGGRDYSSRDGRDIDLTSRDGLRARFGEQVRRIARGVCRLARVVKEDMLSANFEVVVVDPASPPLPQTQTQTQIQIQTLQRTPSTRRRCMICLGVCSLAGCVLATTELGLRCVKRVGGEQLREGESAVLEQRVLLLPKVVLESVVDVLEER
ncbi:hypothetical protein BDQ17DRAFT_1355496 [Cyathus striatus]|nr:hypothetical protein BDQ17DRAFT_1355496 [Cyathus striatus]